MISFFHLLFELLFHYELLGFTCYCQWKLSYELYIFWNLVMGNVACAMMVYLMTGNFITLEALDFDQCSNLFTKFLIRYSNNLHILYSFHLYQEILYFFRINIFPSSDDHVFFSSNNRQVPFFIDNANIP